MASPSRGAGPRSTSDAPAGDELPVVTKKMSQPGTLAGELRISSVRLVRRMRFERSNEQITDNQYTVLAVLSKYGPLTPGELAEREHVQPPTMTRTVNVLAEAGLVTRSAHPTDGRQVLVTVTAAGDNEVKETRRRRDEWLASRLAALGPAERELIAQAAIVMRKMASQ